MSQKATFYKNRLISSNQRRNMLNAYGFLSQETEHRCSGRTTGLAIHAIGLAMTSPGNSVHVQDHHSNRRLDSERLRHLVESICCLLKLEYITAEVVPENEGGGVYVRYEVFQRIEYKV